MNTPPRIIASGTDGASPRHGYTSLRPAPAWQEACLLGSGTLGGLLFGSAEERLILNHERLFYPRHPALPPVDTASHLDELRHLLAEGQPRRAAERVVELSLQEGYGGKRWTDPLIPAAELRLSHGTVHDGDAAYRRTLDFGQGLATVTLPGPDGPVVRRAFTSRADHLAVVHSRAGHPLPFHLTLRPVEPVVEDPYWAYPVAFEPQPVHPAEGIVGFVARFTEADGGWITLARVSADALTVTEHGAEGCSREVSLIIRVIPVAHAADFAGVLATETERLLRLDPEVEVLLSRHSTAHGELYHRVHLDLQGGEDRARPVEQLWAEAQQGIIAPAWLEKIFDAGRYAILCSSGEWPPTLQGIWTGTWFPPWSSDYTLNGNVQAAIDSTLLLHMPEALRSLFTYVESQREHMRENARRLYGAKGLLLASRTSTHGLNNHFDVEWPMTFWTVGAPWIASFYFDYWLHTGDETFARSQALPFMTEAAAFFEDFLVPDAGGRWLFSPSYSPENTPANSDSQACVNATMDLAAVRELLDNLVTLRRALGVESEAGRWEALRERLPEYRINDQGAVSEWASDLEDQDVHRHCSHFYALFRMLPEEIAKAPALRAGFKRAVENRYRERIKGGAASGDVMAFGLAQLGLSAISLGQREVASFAIRRLAQFYYPNAASCHDHAVDPGTGCHVPTIFNTDLSGTMPSLLVRGLIDSAPGRLALMPAAPEFMPRGRLTGLLLRQEICLQDYAWDTGKLDLHFVSRIAQTLEVELPADAGSPEVNGHPVATEAVNPHRKVFRISCAAGQDMHVNVR